VAEFENQESLAQFRSMGPEKIFLCEMFSSCVYKIAYFISGFKMETCTKETKRNNAKHRKTALCTKTIDIRAPF
jgi:hypothetical protein